MGIAVEGAVLAEGGRIVKRLGDGLMATFLQPGEAVRAALEAQAALRGVEVEGHSPAMRAGVHWGCPRKLGGDYLGIDVNIAARAADAAKADQVLVSDAVLARLPGDGLKVGRSRRLRASGAPRALSVAAVSRR